MHRRAALGGSACRCKRDAAANCPSCHRTAARANVTSQRGLPRVCLFVLRWGEWPPWSALLLRTMEHNPSIDFLLLGDHKPSTHRWPPNVAFHEQSLRQVLQRARSALGVAVSRELLSIAGGASKISDLKPMLAHLYPELLHAPTGGGGRPACAFWGYHQEDELL